MADSGDTQALADRLRRVEQAYLEDPGLPWMLAAAALVQSYRQMTAIVQPVLAAVGLTAARADVLQLLASSQDGISTVSQLKSSTFLHAPTMTYNLDWLEQRGFVERVASNRDRRTLSIRITDSGRSKWHDAASALAPIKYGFATLDAQEALSIAQVLATAQTSP